MTHANIYIYALILILISVRGLIDHVLDEMVIFYPHKFHLGVKSGFVSRPLLVATELHVSKHLHSLHGSNSLKLDLLPTPDLWRPNVVLLLQI